MHCIALSDTIHSTGTAAIRHQLANGKIGVASRREYVRTLVGMALWLGLCPPLGRLAGHLGWRGVLHTLQRWWAASLRRYLRVNLDLAGLEHLDRHETYVVTSLHEGFADTLALLHLPLKLRFVVRDELVTWRLLGPYLRDTGQVVIYPERGMTGYRQLLRAARAVFASGESLVIFPQGTILGIETQFREGAFALARALQRLILPVVLTGSHRVWEYPYTPRLRYGQRVNLRVLPPIPAERCCACSVGDLRDDLQQRIKDVALSGNLDPPRRFIPARDGYWDGYAYQIDPRFAELAADVARHRRRQTIWE